MPPTVKSETPADDSYDSVSPIRSKLNSKYKQEDSDSDDDDNEEDNSSLTPDQSSSNSSSSKNNNNNSNNNSSSSIGKNNNSNNNISAGKRKVTRRSVACKSCHALKVKCTPSNPDDPGASCIRCLNAKRKCEIDLNQTRKRRKKAEILEAKRREAEEKEGSHLPRTERHLLPQPQVQQQQVQQQSQQSPPPLAQPPQPLAQPPQPLAQPPQPLAQPPPHVTLPPPPPQLAQQPPPVTLPSPAPMPLHLRQAVPPVSSKLNPTFSPQYSHPQLPSPESRDQEIANLRQRVRMLEGQLRGRRPGSNIYSDSSTDSPPFVSKNDLEQEISILSESSSKLTDLTNELNSLADRRTSLLRNPIPADVVSKGLLTLQDAEFRLQLYKDRILGFLPLVEIPVNITADQLRLEQPFLFNAIMSASNTVNPNAINVDHALALDNEAIRSVCDEVLVVGTKSVELIKSILVLSLYYNSPELFRERRYHLLNTICVSLLHDLGIVARPTFTFTDGSVKQDSESEPSEEYRSLVLIIYFNTVSICLILRRSIYIKWTSYVEECCCTLEKSQFEKYRNLALFARINAALEKIHHIIHSSEMDDKRSSTSDYIINELQARLNELRKKIKDDDRVLLSYFYSVVAYLHEPNLSHMFNYEHGRLSTRAIKAISSCTSSCLAALNEYTKLEPEEVAQMPLAFGSRVMYTGGMLLRLRNLIMTMPSYIDKDLVPRDAVFSVQKVLRLVEQSHLQHPVNYLLKKTRLVMQLFTQTYATQIEELLYRNNETPQNLKPVNSEKPLDILSLAAYHQPYQQPVPNKTPRDEHYFRESRLPLVSMEPNIYNTINDEFWSNLISTDADQINFINNNGVNDEIFFN